MVCVSNNDVVVFNANIIAFWFFLFLRNVNCFSSVFFISIVLCTYFPNVFLLFYSKFWQHCRGGTILSCMVYANWVRVWAPFKQVRWKRVERKSHQKLKKTGAKLSGFITSSVLNATISEFPALGQCDISNIVLLHFYTHVFLFYSPTLKDPKPN